MTHKHYQTRIAGPYSMNPGGLRHYMHRGNYKISGTEPFPSMVE